MGLDWAYNLYLPARNVARALGAIAAIAHIGEVPKSVRVTCPAARR